uniref:Uncharacterized protein n=1 Tax=Setaria viridis TaxID=4556 RepID=A0A4U6V1V8_SETVI|nr:hypothetical protein SEVIR_4G267500v2 [Setaria viridis]
MAELGLWGVAAAEELFRHRISFFVGFEVDPFVFSGDVRPAGGSSFVSFDFGRLKEATADPLRLAFPLLAAVWGGRVEWNFCGIRVVHGCLLSSLDSVLGLLDPFLMLPELVTRASGLRFVEEVRGGARSRRLTADVLLPRTSCSYPKLGVRSSIWLGEFGGLMLGCQPWRTVGVAGILL